MRVHCTALLFLLLGLFRNFHYEIFFIRATRWVRKLYTAEIPSCEPLTVAAATAPVTRKFMNLYCSSSLRLCCVAWEGSSDRRRRVLTQWKIWSQPLFSAQNAPDPIFASLSFLIQLTASQSHRPPAITIPVTVPYLPQHEFSHWPIHVHPILAI